VLQGLQSYEGVVYRVRVHQQSTSNRGDTRAMKRFITQLDEATLARLQACASATSTSVAQVIRLCIERRLPVIEADIKQQQEKNK
jgi:hypothetical protein